MVVLTLDVTRLAEQVNTDEGASTAAAASSGIAPSS